MDKLEVGNVVELNSGGPNMTVSKIVDEETVEATWFRDDGYPASAEFKCKSVFRTKGIRE